jgi:hypothetical protein
LLVIICKCEKCLHFACKMPAVIYICIMMQSAVKVTEYIAISTKWFYNAHMI